ncbi:MAG: class I SAM-dependent methyltransferase [Chloroflexi bacterium]|nr:class I SAM-dependent methyltransferase [Chloroflexota bacterium]
MPFDKEYFCTHAYKDVSFAKFSQYWWSNRFYAILARRYGKRGAPLLEIGSGLGHLVGQLEGSFQTAGTDINQWALKKSLQVAHSTLHVASNADGLPFADGTFGVVIIKHVVEHLPRPESAIAEIGRVTAPSGTLILATPNLSSLLKPWKGDRWIGYQDPTHISLKPPEEWITLIRAAGFQVRRTFADGFWDVPYVEFLPKALQKLFFGAPGGFQAITGFVFLPIKWGESILVIARRKK